MVFVHEMRYGYIGVTFVCNFASRKKQFFEGGGLQLSKNRGRSKKTQGKAGGGSLPG